MCVGSFRHYNEVWLTLHRLSKAKASPSVITFYSNCSSVGYIIGPHKNASWGVTLNTKLKFTRACNLKLLFSNWSGCPVVEVSEMLNPESDAKYIKSTREWTGIWLLCYVKFLLCRRIIICQKIRKGGSVNAVVGWSSVEWHRVSLYLRCTV